MVEQKKHSTVHDHLTRIAVTLTILLATGISAVLYVVAIHPDLSYLDIRQATQTQSSSEPRIAVTATPTSEVSDLTPSTQESTSVMSYQSTNWAGYISTGGKFTSVSGTWTTSVPTATSTTVESGDGTWIGIGGITTSDLIQVGTENTISPTGIVSTAAFYELLPANPRTITDVTLTPGDTVAVSINETSPSLWIITFTNVTTGQTFTTSVDYTSSYSSAEWIQEDPHYLGDSLVLLDDFGTVKFSNALTTVDGRNVSVVTSGASPITMIGQGGAKGHQVTPSDISGNTFTVRYR